MAKPNYLEDSDQDDDDTVSKKKKGQPTAKEDFAAALNSTSLKTCIDLFAKFKGEGTMKFDSLFAQKDRKIQSYIFEAFLDILSLPYTPPRTSNTVKDGYVFYGGGRNVPLENFRLNWFPMGDASFSSYSIESLLKAIWKVGTNYAMGTEQKTIGMLMYLLNWFGSTLLNPRNEISLKVFLKTVHIVMEVIFAMLTTGNFITWRMKKLFEKVLPSKKDQKIQAGDGGGRGTAKVHDYEEEEKLEEEPIEVINSWCYMENHWQCIYTNFILDSPNYLIFGSTSTLYTDDTQFAFSDSSEDSGSEEEMTKKTTGGWSVPSFTKDCDWDVWSTQFEVYLAGRRLTSNTSKVTALVQCLSNDVLKRLIYLVSPTKITDMLFEELWRILKEKFCSTPNVLALRIKLLNAKQIPGQDPIEYLASMTTIAGECGARNMTSDEFTVVAILKGLANDDLRQYLMMPGHDLSTVENLGKLIVSFEQSKQATKEFRRETNLNSFNLNQIDKQRKNNRCTSCGSYHARKETCKARNVACFNCKKIGHFAEMCRSKQQKNSNPKRLANKNHRQHQLHLNSDKSDTEGSQNDLEVLTINTILPEPIPPIIVTCEIEGHSIPFQHDTGAVFTIVDEKVWLKIGQPKIKPFESNLRGYNSVIPLLGHCYVKVQCNNQTQTVPLVVVKRGASLLGRNWIKTFNIRIENELHGSCNQVTSSIPELSQILEEYAEVFEEKLGKCTFEVKLKLKNNSYPKFLKARNLPYALRDAVEKQLEEGVNSGLLTKVTHSEWGTPTVQVRKSDGTIRMCGDYSVTVNPVMDIEEHPLPRIEDIFQELNGCKFFVKLDMRNAYHQLPLDEASSKLTTITTHKGLYRYNRLPFGVASAVAIFQASMEKILQGIPGIVVYLDDITVGGATVEECLLRLKLALQRFKKYNLKLKLQKCEFLKEEIEFLGHELNATGIRPSTNKLKGFKNMPPPKNLKELEAFIGFVNYYSKFVRNFGHLAAPLNDLRKKDTTWKWTNQHQTCFEEIKKRLLCSDLLVHYDQTKDVILATDASDYGVGAVLYHLDNGKEQVIANASRKLSAAEKNYAQIEKEALAIIFGVEKFRVYLLGRKFTLLTDHKPLLHIFGKTSTKSAVAIKRLARWAIILMNYDFTIEYRKTEDFANADALSRLPDPNELPDPSFIEDEEEFQNIFSLDENLSPLNLERIREATKSDPEIQQLIQWIQQGWPETNKKLYKSWWNRRNYLTVGPGYLLFQDKPVIPNSLQKDVLSLLHTCHVGRDRMLMLARDNFWFPKMTTEITKLALACNICNGWKKGQPENLHPWEIPNEFWERIHIDHAGPFLGKTWLVVVDAKTNWLEVFPCSSMTSQTTIKLLKSLFSRFGLPKQLVSDNATGFASTEFEEFCKVRSIRHIFSPPYHPQSNGIAERAVRTFKEWVERHTKAGLNIEDAVQNALLTHRSTRSNQNTLSPAEAVFGHPLRTRLTLHEVVMQGKVEVKSKYKVDQEVWVRSYSQGPRWRRGKILKVCSSVTYLVDCENQILFRHVDQIRQSAKFTYTSQNIYPSFNSTLSHHYSSVKCLTMPSVEDKMDDKVEELSFEDSMVEDATLVRSEGSLTNRIKELRRQEAIIGKEMKALKTATREYLDEYSETHAILISTLEDRLGRRLPTDDIAAKLNEIHLKLMAIIQARDTVIEEFKNVRDLGFVARKELKDSQSK